MEQNTNSLKVKQFSLTFEEDPIKYRHINEDPIQNGTKQQGRSSQWIKIIVYFVLILSAICTGFILLLEVPYHEHVSNMSSNMFIDPSIGMKDIKVDGSSAKINIIPGNVEKWPMTGNNKITDPDNYSTDCNILDEVLLGERRSRLDAVKSRQLTQEQKMFWGRIHLAWMATSMSIVPMDDSILDFMVVLSMMKTIVSNATQELKKEGFELLHDLFIEEHQSQNQTDESMDWMCALRHFTDNIPRRSYTPALALKTFNVLGECFNLYYQKIEIGNSKNFSNKFMFGKFVYRGKDPEKLYVRNVRHILNAIVRLLLKIENPSAMRTMCGDTKLETEPKKAKNMLFKYIKESLKHSDNPYSSSSERTPARRRKRSLILRPDLMEDPNAITSKRFQSSMEMFFDKMEVLASHIDRLHERYITLNELNDDYISREFSVESGLTDDS